MCKKRELKIMSDLKTYFKDADLENFEGKFFPTRGG